MTDVQSRDCHDDQNPRESVHIASLLVHVRPQFLASVSQWFGVQAELEIHLADDAGKLVVIVETRDHHQINPLIETIKDQQGVLNVVMVYHEELALADIDDELAEETSVNASANTSTINERDAAQPVKIVGEM